ncbi:uncharacterized protein N7477_002556 [Penicillium maclennaniae]|uniref:uncharacterized protein n=1 Tax=Penicillium maclennaniae TaxID=1343394 RepID=UPI0025402BE6|nr:uncharacterized protein N7477_002556 [Penicillium maclennaniae]KAJ5676923.1 hypothetical protein N7477_002556 [Penicillium maclennaniae]
MPQAKSDRKKTHAPYQPRLQGLEPKNQPKPAAPRTRQQKKQTDCKLNSEDHDSSAIDLSITIPISLQQLLLDVFKTALFTRSPVSTQSTDTLDAASEPDNARPDATEGAQLDTKSLVQTIKTHLYQRDFDSAFTEADDSLLRVYALRWSAARALGYAGIFKAVLRYMRAEQGLTANTRVVSIGGGAGAEIVALGAVWRDLHDGVEGLGDRLEKVSLKSSDETEPPKPASLDVVAVDIADWSSVIDRLQKTMGSSNVPTPRSSKHQPPLTGSNASEGGLSVSFLRTDVLTISEPELKDVLHGTATATTPPSLLVTLMFTLNELFSTSMAKTTGLLLRMTELLPPGAVLLVVDSPGSYSSLKLGKDGVAQERNYPMKFLLDHTLLSVAEGKWERVLSQDSRWWRRDTTRLRYEVGEGAGLEDMRYQVHLYKRLT